MTSTNGYQPRAEDKFSFGLWTVGNPGRDATSCWAMPVGTPRKPCMTAANITMYPGRLIFKTTGESTTG